MIYLLLGWLKNPSDRSSFEPPSHIHSKHQTHTHSPRPEVDPARYFAPSALDQPITPPPSLVPILGPDPLTPLEMAARLRGVYCQGKWSDFYVYLQGY